MISASIWPMSEWSESLVTRIAGAIRTRRQQLGLSVQEVADRTAELGHPLNRSTLSDLENGRRKDRLLIGDALALAHVLRMPVGALLYPNLPDGRVETVPGTATDSLTALDTLVRGPEISDKEIAELVERDDMPQATALADWSSGGELIRASRDLVKHRKSLADMTRRYEELVEKGNTDDDLLTMVAETIETKKRVIALSSDLVRNMGGVVNDG